MGQYPFGSASTAEHQRLTAIQETYDPETIRHLEARGVNEGWQCLEVGAGAGSVALWLCKRVGSTGHVIATDLNTQFLFGFREQNLEVIHHDITTDDLPNSQFDLVHTRFLLDLLSERDKVLDKMVEALKPGGWLVVEEFDSLTSVSDSSIGDSGNTLFLKIQNAMRQMWEQDGFDAEYGRKLLGKLHARGLEELGAEGRVFMRQGDTRGTQPWRLSVEQLRAKFVRSGFATEEEIDRHQMLLDNPKLFYLSPLKMTAWGRRPVR